ncbi:MAG: crossover junction endodeoxyribonuclease RuvC [Methyloligellaceae bacterium]
MTKQIRIIGIDPGLRNTGWGIIETDGVRLSYIDSGVIKADKDEELAFRLLEIYKGLCSILHSFAPHEAAVEQTFVNKDATATLKLGQARGIALLAPAEAGLRVAEYAPNAVKKTVVGSGHADKHQVSAMMSYLLPKAKPKVHDEVDALAIAITHAHHRQVSARVEEQLKKAAL